MTIENAWFAVQRDGTLFSCKGSELKDKLKGGDLMVVQRAGVTSQWEVASPPPWEGHDGGIWHIKNNASANVVWLTFSPFTAWDVDGQNERQITQVEAGEELVFVTGPSASRLFRDNLGTWDFGELTDTSKVTKMDDMFSFAKVFNSDISNWNVDNVTDMRQMFSNAWVFNSDISNWNVDNVTDMDYMFSGARSFNQDLSQWCVEKITSEPVDFDLDADDWTQPRPCWGECGCPPPPPWDGHDGGVFHIITDNVDVQLNNHYTIWDIDLQTSYTGNLIPKNSEKIFLTGPDCTELFSAWDLPNNRHMSCRFGSYTNTSRVTNMKEMFSRCESFNAEIGDWDVSKVTNMDNMFDGCWNFNSDLSEWCVSEILNPPAYFAPVLSSNNTPVWGTCPRGENQ